LAFLVLLAVYLFSLGYGKDTGAVARLLTQWDGQHYLSIADNGYELFPCPGMPGYICGNVGWFPFYPLVAHAVTLTDLDTRYAVLVVSWIALAISLVLVYRLVLRRAGTVAATWTMIAIICQPTAFYFLTAFPYSLLLLLAVIAFDMMDRGAFHYLWLPTGLAAITYPSGATLALPVLFILATNWNALGKKGKMHLLAAVCSPVIAIAVYFGYYWWEFGDFFLYVKFQGQSYYAHELAFPFVTIARTLSSDSLTSPSVLYLLYAAIVGIAFYSRRLPLTWYVWLWGILLFTPTMGTLDCYYRHAVVAFPLSVCVGIAASLAGKRKPLAWLAIGAAIAMASSVYFEAYRSGQLM
jgi:hypothetical protein